VAGIVALVSICVGGYVLNRKKMHLAFISIGVDYMQVLAIFARSKVQWPPFIREMFRWMSMFNLNIDITAPECTIPEVSYSMKWFAIQLLPVAICILLVVVFVSVFLVNWVIKGRRGRQAREHGVTLQAVFTLMFYYMYLLLTRTTFDVFNCQPTDPHDGYEPGYMEAVFEPCYLDGGMHMTLFYPAIVCLLFYVVGYPIFVLYSLYAHRFQIKADQILRAMDLGETPTNPFYSMRRIYHKLYYHFVPDKWYWILMIIFRKFCIALTSLMFRRTPSFQMALCFCILFFSYAMHAQNVPYMSMASRRQVVLTHKMHIKAEKHLKRHLQLHNRIE
jgi:heme/copper-type cytochrome/quinol oxidase subunit 2